MAITSKEKELIAVGVSVASGCQPCTDYHIKAVRRLGAFNGEIGQAVADALAVRQAASAIMARHARAHLGKGWPETGHKPSKPADRIKTLVSIGAAFGANCVESLEQHLAEAEMVGISPDEIATIVKLAAFIKTRAALHVERLVSPAEEKAA